MRLNKLAVAPIVCFFLCLCFLPFRFLTAADIKQGFRPERVAVTTGSYESIPAIREDSADVVIVYTSTYPGSKDFLVDVYLSNPVAIAGFDFEMIITPPELADFSTVDLYVDSLDTCEGEETCWYFYPVRECLIQRGPLIEDWSILEAHGATQDTIRPLCDTLWNVGIALGGTPIPSQTGYVILFYFGVDLSCMSDTVEERTFTLDFTGHLSNELGELVPFRSQPGKLDILPCIPGDVNADGTVDIEDVLYLLNYLYRDGFYPCVMEAADPNADCLVELGDAVYLISYLFKGGAPPMRGCAH
jgi:hypothetical protein